MTHLTFSSGLCLIKANKGTKKAKFFGIVDLTQRFHQIALTIDAKRAFGMKGGFSWFQQNLAQTVLKDYLYDICELYNVSNSITLRLNPRR